MEHSGSLFACTSEEALWPASGYGVVLLFNSGSPMMLDQTAIAHGVFDIIEGTAHPRAALTWRPGSTPSWPCAPGGTGLGTAGVVRAGSWARRRHRASVRAALGLLPPVLVLATGVVFPRLAEAWIGRNVTWRAAAYEWPALVFVGAALIAAAGTLLARSWRWWARPPRATAQRRPERGRPDRHRSSTTSRPYGRGEQRRLRARSRAVTGPLVLAANPLTFEARDGPSYPSPSSNHH